MIPPVLPTYARAPLSFVEGEGPWLTEAGGERYLDLGAGIAVTALGHAHPALVAALEAQGRKLWHTSNLYQIPNQQALAERLVAATFADTVFVTNSGTEAIECAIKMARKHFDHIGQPERVRIIACEGSFHGRSYGAISAAGSEKMVKGFGPVVPGLRPCALRRPGGDRERDPAADGGGADRADPGRGRHPGAAARESAGAARALRRARPPAHPRRDPVRHGADRAALPPRVGRDHPDIMTVAKAIGGGFPLGACLATEEAAAGMTTGTHGSTYGGNPLGCAVGCAVMDIVTEPGFLDQVSRLAGRFRQGLEGLVAAHPEVFEAVRGEGLMLGLKCRKPNAEVVRAGYDARVLVVPAAENVVRLLPPLNLTEAEAEEGLRRLDAAAAALEAAAA